MSPTALGNLPREKTSFVGRLQELSDITRLVRTAPVVTVTGVGGVGKTRLALQAAERLGEYFADGTWLVELSGLHDADLLGHVVADTLGVADQTARPVHEVLTDFFADKELLLILDTCEHMVSACARFISRLIPAAPGLRVLATSRQPLDVLGERQVVIQPLPVPEDLQGAAERTEGPRGDDALVLFAERAAAVAPGFAVTPHNRPAVARLCRRLEGIPLAIELAAVRLRDAPPPANDDQGHTAALLWLAERLEDRLGLLSQDSEAVAPRHQALRTTIGWSHELCAPGERLLWTRLSVFSGRFDLVSAAAVCADEMLPTRHIGGLADQLVARSILLREGAGSEARYRMLDTVREYGRQWLDELGETGTLLRRHRDHYLHVVRQAEVACLGSDQVDWSARLRRFHTDIRAALDFSLGDGAESRIGCELAGRLQFFWTACGFLHEGRHYLERALALTRQPCRERRRALFVCSWVAIGQADWPAARALAEQCLAESEAVGDADTAADASANLGMVTSLQGDLQVALPLLHRARERLRTATVTEHAPLMACIGLAIGLITQEDTDRAVEILGECDRLCEKHGEVWSRSYVDFSFALAERVRGDCVAAKRRVQAALRAKRLFRDTTGYTLCLEVLAWLAEFADDPIRAARLLGAAEQIAQSSGTRMLESAYYATEHERCVVATRRRLGDDGYAAAFREGKELILDDAIDYALGDIEFPAPRALIET